MPDRWRRAVPAALAIIVATLLGGSALVRAEVGRPALRVSAVDGGTISVIALPDDASFALRYRNSLYGTEATERFVAANGEIRLTGLAAEQLAVLEEYYAIDAPARRDRASGWWSADPAHRPVTDALRIAATDLGERTLLVDGAPPLPLWRMVDDRSPHVILEVVP